MEHTLGKIACKPNDYKICPICNRINWYENEECIECGKNIKDIDFADEEHFNKLIQEEYHFWIDVEGYTESEADDILMDI